MNNKKKCQIDIDVMAWNRLKTMRPLSFSSMAKYAAHILEEYSLNINQESQVRLLGSNDATLDKILKRLDNLELQAGITVELLPDIEEPTIVEEIDEEPSSLSEIDLESLPLAELRVLGAAHLDKEYKTRRALLQHLHAAQEALLEQQAEEDTVIWETTKQMKDYTRTDLRNYAIHLRIPNTGNKKALLERITAHLLPEVPEQKSPKKPKKKKSGFIMPDLS